MEYFDVQQIEMVKCDLEKLLIPFSNIEYEKKMGRYVPDIVISQYGKIASIIEVKLKKPNRESFLRIINLFRVTAFNYSIGSFILAYFDTDKMVYLDLTSIVVSQESDISSFLNDVDNRVTSLSDALSPYIKVTNYNTSKEIKSFGEKKKIASRIVWFGSLFSIILIIVLDALGVYPVTWERLLMVLAFDTFLLVPFSSEIYVGKDGVKLVMAKDGNNGKKK